MQAEKRVSVSFRVTPEFKRCLELAAESEQRSQTNMLEWIVLDFCRRKGLVTPSSPESSSAGSPKGSRR